MRTEVKIGGKTLVSYDYEELTNRLERLNYGNQDYVEYTYDSQGRLLKETYEDGETVSYQYDNCGNLATVTDSETGTVTTYYYDLLNRIVGYREKSASLDHSVVYVYDSENNLSSMTETVNGVDKQYTYTYNEDNRLIAMAADGTTVEYTYDSFGRLQQQVTSRGDTVILTETVGYSGTDTTTSGQIVSYNGYTYTYDGNGNILSVSDGTHTTSYVYDSANQLIRENNQAGGFTHTWTYDNAGNITSRKEYAYTTGDLGAELNSIAYSYNSKVWCDLLRYYGEDYFTYDGVGNVVRGGEWIYWWKHGRQLSYMTKGDIRWDFTYNADGMRTERSPGDEQGTYTYVYNGSKLTQMSVHGVTLNFTYDTAGTPLTVTVGNAVYYYKTNLQGDVVGILNSAGIQVVTYTYDAWGNMTYTATDEIAEYNPLTYRGYVYDKETGLYYLQSRYYNPQWGRFLNADAQINASLGILGLNLFSYCLNNPVKMVDYGGNKPGDLFDTMDEAAKDAAIYLGALSFENGWEYITVIYSVTEIEKTYKTVTKTYNFLCWSWTKTSTKVIRTKVKKYTYKAVRTDKDPWGVSIPWAPLFRKRLATVHTHPMGSGQGITRFSEVDINTANDLGLIDYVYGPNGQLRKYDPSTEEDILLFSDLPVSTKKPWLD